MIAAAIANCWHTNSSTFDNGTRRVVGRSCAPIWATISVNYEAVVVTETPIRPSEPSVKPSPKLTIGKDARQRLSSRRNPVAPVAPGECRASRSPVAPVAPGECRASRSPVAPVAPGECRASRSPVAPVAPGECRASRSPVAPVAPGECRASRSPVAPVAPGECRAAQ